MSEKKSLEELNKMLADAAQVVKVNGRYRHYKGTEYTVLMLVINEADNVPYVIYRAEYGDQLVFSRPVESWLEEVHVEDGTIVKRFTLLSNS